MRVCAPAACRVLAAGRRGVRGPGARAAMPGPDGNRAHIRRKPKPRCFQGLALSVALVEGLYCPFLGSLDAYGHPWSFLFVALRVTRFLPLLSHDVPRVYFSSLQG